MTTIFCKQCTTQIREKAAEHDLCHNVTDQEYEAVLSMVYNKLNEELTNRQPYPLFQDEDALVCQAHFFDPEANVQLFDEWLEQAYQEVLS